MSNKILIIGQGGREHALGYSIAQDPEVDEVLYAKGNPGTAREKKGRNIELDGTKKENFKELADIVEKEDVNQMIVGPEQPLVDGIVDFFNDNGFYDIFGPRSIASVIEADKFYSYDLMNCLGIPQAESILCSTIGEAESAINKMITSMSIVIKARGLTEGKGIHVCDDKEEALFKLKGHVNKYGPEVLIAERLFGEEFSVFGISNGETIIPLEMSVQDHKRLLDNDKGPNTGGMGAYGPALIADSEMIKYVTETMMTPVVKGMKKDGREYKGFLYAAVIITEQGPKILEYNCRFGDPEAQPSVMMFKHGLYQPISTALDGRLNEVNIEFKPGAACCVVMASNGYPANYEKELSIGGLDEVAKLHDVKVFHAGTTINNGRIVTDGGRVLGITAYSSEGIVSAQKKAYEAADIINKASTELNNKITFIYRKDIGSRGLI